MSSGTPELTAAGKPPLLTSIFQCSAEFLEQLRFYFEQNPPTIPISNIPGFTLFTVQNAPSVLTSQTTASTSYTDLATVGPQLTGLPDGKYVVEYGGFCENSADGNLTVMSVQVNSTTAADADQCGVKGAQGAYTMRAISQTLSNGGSNTLTVKYKVGAGTGTFLNRWLFAQRYANL